MRQSYGGGGTITLGIVLKGHSIAKVENNCPGVFIVIKVPRALWQCLHEKGFEPVSVKVLCIAAALARASVFLLFCT